MKQQQKKRRMSVDLSVEMKAYLKAMGTQLNNLEKQVKFGGGPKVCVDTAILMINNLREMVETVKEATATSSSSASKAKQAPAASQAPATKKAPAAAAASASASAGSKRAHTEVSEVSEVSDSDDCSDERCCPICLCGEMFKKNGSPVGAVRLCSQCCCAMHSSCWKKNLQHGLKICPHCRADGSMVFEV